MDPITLGLIATSALGRFGQLLGQKKRTQISPEMLKQTFGAKAITDEQMELFNRAIGSAQGQQLMTSAAQSGQQFQTDVARQSAQAGLGAGAGASGGADVFAGAASQSAVSNLQGSMKANLMEAMLPVAQQLVGDRMRAWLSDRNAVLGQTTKFQDIMGAVSGLSSDLLASREASGAGQDTQPTTPSNWTNTPGYEGYTDFIPGAAPPKPGTQMPNKAVSTGTEGTAPASTMPQVPPARPTSAAPTMDLSPTSHQRQMQQLLTGGGGRFLRSMGTNRFGLVQPA